MAPQPPVPGPIQQQRMYGMPPAPVQLPNQSMSLSHTGQSKIDPNQIPRPIRSSSVIIHETRQGNQANPPPVITRAIIREGMDHLIFVLCRVLCFIY